MDIRCVLRDFHELHGVWAYRDDGAMLLGKAIGSVLCNPLVGGCERVVCWRQQTRFEAEGFILLVQHFHHFRRGCEL